MLYHLSIHNLDGCLYLDDCIRGMSQMCLVKNVRYIVWDGHGCVENVLDCRSRGYSLIIDSKGISIVVCCGCNVCVVLFA